MKKFRAWDIKNEKYIDIIGFYYFDNHIVLWFLDSEGLPNYKNYHVKGIILEQCSGKKDKYGIDIFEGDRALYNGREYQIIFKSGAFGYMFLGAFHWLVAYNIDELVIIGNTHEQ